jgi:hypothetical protein
MSHEHDRSGAIPGVASPPESETPGSPAFETDVPLRGGLLTGHLAGVDPEGRLLFEADGREGEAFPVSIGVPVSDGALVKGARLRRRGLVAPLADGGFVLVGFARERVAPRARDAGPGELEVIVDGETLQLTAERQIELRCGKASLLLRADGRVILSGTYVVSTSRGPNKIKGATIALN